MTFFYDLNKRMADLSQKQTLTEGAVAERATGDYSAKKAAAGRDIGKPGKNFEKIAKSAGERYGSKAAGERVAGAVLNKLRHPKESMGMPPTGKKPQEKVNELSPDTIKSAASKRDSQTPNQMSQATHRKDPMVHATNRINMNKRPNGMKETEMTAKQKSFAALAEPKDKITFADKIAGAKKEVDEMLGDVAAEAMRNALGGRQQVADEGNAFTGALAKTPKGGKFKVGGKEFTDTSGIDEEEDLNPFTNYKKPRRDTPRTGEVTHGAKHDIKHTSTGRIVTRRTDNQGISVGSDTDDEGNTQEKRGRGRPKGAPKGPERTTAKAYKHKGDRKVKEGDIEFMVEPHDSGEYDREGDMAKDSIKTVVRHAQALEKILGDNDNLPEWVQSKLAKIESMMTAVDDYMQNQQDDDEEMAVGEESTNKRDNRAEKAGKKVTKDIEYDEKKKEKKVDETTTSGAVATGGDTPKASKGGMQIGKGIYDSLNREVEGMIAESMSINVSMSNDDNGTHKNITVTASDEDAEVLAQLLRSAGLGGGMSSGNQETCPSCGSTGCGCDENMAEAYGDTDATQNQPDWPTNTEYSDDAMQYSGGLNKPKTDVAGDGQTTIPVTAVHAQDEDALRRMMEMAGIDQSKLKPWERTMKEEEAVDEGVLDKIKDAGKKVLDTLGHGSDEDLRKDLQKKMGLPPTGKKPEPKDDNKMQESLMQEFENFRI